MPADTRQKFLTSADQAAAGIYDPMDFAEVDRRIMANTLEGVKRRFPISNDRYILDVDELSYPPGEDLTLKRQKEAILNGESLSRRLKGRWILKDALTGNVVSKSGHTTILNAPVLTERGTFIRNGSEVALVNMFRLNPGVYHRVRNNGLLEAHVNPEQGTGGSFKIEMDPDKAVFDIRSGGRKVNFYNTLKESGATDAEVDEALGKDIADANRKISGFSTTVRNSFPGGVPRHQMMKLAQEIGEIDDDEDEAEAPSTKEEPANPVDKVLFSEKMKLMKLDPRATEITLGAQHPTVGYKTLLASAKRLLSISRGESMPDKRDSMEFQRMYSAPDYFGERIARDGGRVARSMLWKATNRGNLDFVQAGMLNPHIGSVFNESSLSQYIEGSSPVEALDTNAKITRIGEGGIGSTRGAPEESRLLQDSYKNFVDPARTVDRMRVGLDMYLAHGARKGGDGLLYNKFMDARTGLTDYLDSHTASRKIVSTSEYINSKDATVPAFFPGKGIELVPKKSVDYYIPDDNTMFSTGSNTVPFKGGASGLRVNMGSKYPMQAMPLVNREAPLVRNADGDSDIETGLGARMGVRKASADGVVQYVDEDMITVKTRDGRTEKYDLYSNFPVNKKGYMQSYLNVKAGQPVRAGEVLAYSNYTDKDGVAALGTNLRTAYVNWKGLTFEDALVISESAARKMTSQNTYRQRLSVDDSSKVDKGKYKALYPGKFTADQYKMVDDSGMVRPGTVVNPGDPLILGYVENAPSPMSMGRRITSDKAERWDNDYPGIVTDVRKGKNYYAVYVRADVPMTYADKASNRFGGKGVISNVIPDKEMPTDKDGRPFEMLVSPLSVLTRSNPAQLAETAYGKIAMKTGRPVAVKGFSGTNMVQDALDALKANGMEETEELTDPSTGRKIPGVFTGSSYFYKLKHTGESKESARGSDEGYTMDETPMLGSSGKSKRLGSLEVSALIGHSAREVLKDAKLIKGQENSEFWRAFRMGETPMSPGEPLIHRKFYDTLKASGVNIKTTKNSTDIFGMTDNDVRELTGGRQVKTGATYSAKDLRPAMGGLFDPNIFGRDGGQFGYIALEEPVLNPVMENSVRSILGLTEKKFNAILKGEDEIPGRGKGAQAFISALDAMDPRAEAAKAMQLIKASTGNRRDAAIKRFRALVSIEKQGLQPADFFLTRIPVLPPKYRQITSAGDTIVSADANYLYKRLIDTVDDVKTAKDVLPDEDILKAKAGIYEKYRDVVGMHRPEDVKLVQKNVGGLLEWVFGKGSAKTGAFHRRMTSMAMDLVGRGVITPNPALKLNEVGLPESQAWDTYEPFVTRKLVQRGYPATTAVKMVADRGPEAYKALKEAVHERPVLMTRAPSLHKYNIMAFWPVLTKGKHVQISPSIVKPMAADYDGDTVNFYVPTTSAATKEAIEKMMPEHNLINPRFMKAQYKPEAEYQQGMYLMSKPPAGLAKRSFHTRAEAALAYRRGEIGVDEPINVIEK